MPPRLARLLAIVAAVVLVVGAFALRGALSGDDGEGVTAGSGSGSGTEPEGSSDEGRFDVLCDLDLGEAACDALDDSALTDDVEVVPRGSVAGLLEGEGGDRWDAWLTLDPMPGAMDAERAEDGLPPLTDLEALVPVASSTLAVLTYGDSPFTCATTVTWSCLTEPVRPGVAIASPSTSVGAVSLAAGAAALMGTTDFGSRQFEGDPARDDLADLLDEVPPGGGPTTASQTGAMLQPGSASAAITTTGLADLRAGTAQGRGRGLRTAALTPEVTVGVVLAGLGPQAVDSTRALENLVTGQTVGDALAEAGWDGAALLTTGLPDPDVVYAILEELS